MDGLGVGRLEVFLVLCKVEATNIICNNFGCGLLEAKIPLIMLSEKM